MLKRCTLFIFLLTVFITAYSQISVRGIPESFKIQTKQNAIIPQKTLDIIDSGKLVAEDIAKGISNRFAVIQQLNIDIKEVGVQTKIDNSGYIWRYKIQSPQSYSLGIYFSKFNLPPEASVFIYNESHSKLMGAFTSINNKSGGQLPIAEFKDKVLIIEYFEPLNSAFSGELVIGSVSQAYKDVIKASQARIGINCPEGANWQDVKHSVCWITFDEPDGKYECTGFLINNARLDGTPYFQTANHCINTVSAASSMVAYFNYENSTCSGNDATEYETLAGAEIKATSTYSDFTLLELNEAPPANYTPFFAG
jgi:hypothetical protein